MERQTGRSAPCTSGAPFDIVALAASAGGLTALSRVLAALPGNFPAVIVVVQHLDPRHRSLMADILSRRTPLRVKQAEEGEQVAPATVYIAPPNRHLLVNPDSTLSLSQSELVPEFFGMPSAAIHSGSVDFVLPLDEIPTALVTLVIKGEAE